MKHLFAIVFIGLVIGGSNLYGQNRVDQDSLIFSKRFTLKAYYNGKLFSGIGFTVYENGQLSSEQSYKEGKKDGLYKKWYENGQLNIEENYKEGKKDGLYKKWYYNSQIKREGSYKDGEYDGLQRMWYENGQLDREVNFKYGELISIKCWSKDGNEIECF
jgi:antitoxin component YwqK of YwqJK toxin-antitoxin module